MENFRKGMIGMISPIGSGNSSLSGY